jgi:hypothetical protein
VIVALATVVVQVQVQQARRNFRQPLFLRDFAKEAPVADVKTVAEPGRVETLNQGQQGVRGCFINIFQRQPAVILGGHGHQRGQGVGSVRSPGRSQFRIAPAVVAGVHHHQVRPELVGGLQGLGQALPGHLAHHRLHGSGTEIEERGMNCRPKAAGGKLSGDGGEMVGGQVIELRTLEGDLRGEAEFENAHQELAATQPGEMGVELLRNHAPGLGRSVRAG